MMNKDTLMDYEPGQIVIITEGQYSEYGILGVYRVKKRMNTHQVWAMIRFHDSTKRHDDQKIVESDEAGGHFDAHNFTKMLVMSNFIEGLSTAELHLGSYGTLPGWLDPEGEET